MALEPNDTSERLRTLLGRVGDCARRAGRRPDEVHLLAVSKTFPFEAILSAYEAGQRHFGENYLQEARPKAQAARSLSDICWHLIGPLQRNKINQALEIFSYIHSVDSLDLLRAINERAERAGRKPKIFLQVRLGGEESKHGFEPSQIVASLDELAAAPPRSVELVGLMTIPPPVELAEENRPHFRQLRHLSEEIRARRFTFFQDYQLSMGMSDDFPVAIEEGATWIRVGRALFGSRPVFSSG